MASVTNQETDLRTRLMRDQNGALAYELISQFSHASSRWRAVHSPRILGSAQVHAPELARVHSLAAHVIDTLAPRLRNVR